MLETEPGPVGLLRALDEMGPNHLTEFADELEIEGRPKPPGGYFPMWESIGTFREKLTDLMVGKEMAFAGGVAVRSYGARPGPTGDYDILTSLADEKLLWPFLLELGFMHRGPFGDADKFTHKEMGFDVDVLRASSPLYREALAMARPSTWRGRKLKIVSHDHLAAMKVKGYAERLGEKKREIDRKDFLGLLKTGAEVERVKDILQRLAPEFLPALNELLGEQA